MYDTLKKQAAAMIAGEKNFIVNAANISALIYNELPALNWAGFYMWTGRDLLLGPFVGKPACVRIALGKGVCGMAARRLETIVVPDVHQFPGHIPCDSASNSEIVVPMFSGDDLYGVMDIDSPEKGRFSPEDAAGLEDIAALVIEGSDMQALAEFYSRY
jgi:GAF domain-containing protein